MMRRSLRRFSISRTSFAAVILFATMALGVALFPVPRAFSRPTDAMGDAALLDGYRHVEVASVSDAMEKLIGQRIYLSHRMRPIFTSKFAGFAVFALGTVPSTSVGHYRFAGANIPVVCDGVAVSAGDIVVADSDGVVVVPRAKAADVLTVAQEMDFKEHSMYAYIEKLKSIEEAVKKFGRL